MPRARNRGWPAWRFDHPRPAEAVVTVRCTTRSGLSGGTAATLRSWPVLVEVGDVVVRRPHPAR